MARTLYARDIDSAMRCAEIFGKEPGLMVARPTRGCAPYLMIPHGFYALVTKFGAEVKFGDEANGSCVWYRRAYGCRRARPSPRPRFLL